MRHARTLRVGCSCFLAGLLVVVNAASLAQQAPDTGPATPAPAEEVAKPQAAEAPGQPAPVDRPPRVLVLPFESLTGESDETSAIARATQRSLVLDLSRSRQFVVQDSDKAAADRAAAVAAGKDAQADYVVWGNLQYVDGRLRIGGEVLDATRDDSVGEFKLTGTLRELFELQDMLTEQVSRRLGRAVEPQPLRDEVDDRADVDDRDAPPAEGPASEPIRIRPHSLDPAWLEEPDVLRDEVTRRYNYGQEPYWAVPYASLYGYGYGGYGPYGYARGYHHSYYRPYRPLYQHRSFDYTFRGIPDRRPYRGFGPSNLRSFNGPVPMRWIRPD